MAIHAMQGLMGAGKSCVAVNKFLRSILEETSRPIYTNLPLRWVGEQKHGEVEYREEGGRGFYFNVRTQQPAELLQLVADTARGHGRRQAMMARIHFLRGGTRTPRGEDGQPLRYQPLDEEGKPLADAQAQEVGPKHGVREFWYFTQANACVFLDEVADIWSTEDRKNRPDTLKTYVRHHRHYKDDLYFFFQDKEDIDPDLRRKIQYLWTVRNSTKENIWDHWAVRGIKWPVQFFIVKCYLGRGAVGKPEDSLKTMNPQEAWNFFPWASHFRTYWSFSEANSLPGKKAAKAEQRSTDLDPSWWGKCKAWVENLGGLIALSGGALVGLYMAYRLVMGLLGTNSGQLAPKVKDHAPASAAVGGTNTFGNVDTKADLQEDEKPERLELVTPRTVKTNKRTYEIGDRMGDGVVARVLLNGVEYEGGRQARFRDLFLPGERRESRGSGGGDGGALPGLGAGAGLGGGTAGQRPAGRP